MQKKTTSLLFFLLLFQIIFSQTVVDQYNKAKEFYETGKNKECISLLQSIEKQIGANPKIYSLYVKAYLGIHDFTNAAIAFHKFKKLVGSKSSPAITEVLALESQINDGLEQAQQEHQKNISINRNKEADAIIAEAEQRKALQRKTLQELFVQERDASFNASELTRQKIDNLRNIIPDSIRSVYYQKLRNSKQVLYQFNITFSDSTLRNVKYCSITENDEDGIEKYSYSISFDEKNYPLFSEEMLSREFYSKSNKKALPARLSLLQDISNINGKRWWQYVTKSIDGNGIEMINNSRYILFINKKSIVDSIIEGSEKHVYKSFYNNDYSLLLQQSYTAYKNNKKDYYSSTIYTYSTQFNATTKSRIESLEDDSGWELDSKPNPKWVITESSGRCRFNFLGDIIYEGSYQKGKLTESTNYNYEYDQFGQILYGKSINTIENNQTVEQSRSFIHYVGGNKTGYSEYYSDMGFWENHRKNYAQAIAFYQKSLTYKPDDSLLLTYLARNYSLYGKSEEAIKYAEKAIEINPFGSNAYYLLGTIYRGQGEVEKGTKLIETAAEMGSIGAKEWLKTNKN